MLNRRTFLAGAAVLTATGLSLTGAQAAEDRPLVVYFSCTGNTKAVAEQIAALTGGDIFEIVPAKPYSDVDLDYKDKTSRCYVEMHDRAARPAIAGTAPNFASYKTVYLGFPNWWNTFPRIINTFLETYDFNGKVIHPFCTSGSSGVENSVAEMMKVVPTAIVRDGLRIAASSARSSNERIARWVKQN